MNLLGREQRRPEGCWQLLTAFTLIALQGVGGALPVARRALCEERRWLSEAEFLECVAVGGVLPGANVCNLAILVGHRFHGWRGALAALAGLLAAPLIVVLSLAALYARFEAEPVVAGAARGISAVSGGLFAGTALKLAGALRESALGVRTSAALAAAAFTLLALLHVPLAWTLGLLTGPAWLLARRRVPDDGRP